MTLKSSSPFLKELVPMAEYIYSGIFNTKLKNSYRLTHAEKFGVPNSVYMPTGQLVGFKTFG